MIGYATFDNERVAILDKFENHYGRVEYLINYDGPLWVRGDELSDIETV